MIELFYMDSSDRNIEEHHQKKIDRNNQLLFSKIFNSNNLSRMYPYSIEIETINRCNNDCSFCPVNRNNDSRAPMKMSENLYKNIINQLSDMKYSGYLSLFSNNEPLLDKRLIDFLEYARRRLPEVRLCLFTNGILLTPEIYEKLSAQLNYLVIDNYSDELKLIPSVELIFDKYRSQKTKCNVKIYIRKKTQILSSRGGESPNRNVGTTYEGGCMMPLMQIVVRPDGKISKCCQDGLGLSEIGDVTKETIIDAFKNKSRNCLCTELMDNGRSNISGCKHCDVFGHDNYMPSEWKPLIISQFIDIVSKRKFEQKKIILIGEKNSRKKIKELLQNFGIQINEEHEDAEGIRDEKCNFYILKKYEEPLLSLIDPNSDKVGQRWIVYEKIPEYIIHDSSEQIYQFANILKKIMVNLNAIYFYGDDDVWNYLNRHLQLEQLKRIDLNCEWDFDAFENQSIVITNGVSESELNNLKTIFKLSDNQILSYERLKDFMESI